MQCVGDNIGQGDNLYHYHSERDHARCLQRRISRLHSQACQYSTHRVPPPSAGGTRDSLLLLGSALPRTGSRGRRTMPRTARGKPSCSQALVSHAVGAFESILRTPSLLQKKTRPPVTNPSPVTCRKRTLLLHYPPASCRILSSHFDGSFFSVIRNVGITVVGSVVRHRERQTPPHVHSRNITSAPPPASPA